MAWLIIEKGDNQELGRKFSLGDKALLIGRATSEFMPDIALHDEYVSRRHAEVSFAVDHFLLRDLNSTNGTALDGLAVEPGNYYPLKQDSLIGLGVALGLEARVSLRFKESPTVTTTKIDLEAAPLRPSGWLEIDADRGEVRVDGKLIVLSRKEYDLIVYLKHMAGKVCQKDDLVAEVWPEAADAAGVSDAAVDQLVHRLRLKIELDPGRPVRLTSRKGFGYTLVCE